MTKHSSRDTDVAMFVDWENMHGYIRGKANVSALKEVAEGYGRLVLAKAYADWREDRFQRDSQVLYKIGVEPVYVPTGYKNNADVKLSTDCIDFAYRHKNIGVFILVTGDGDFIHVANTLRPLGKKVIVVAQSNNASARLGDLVDTLLIYDKDVETSGSTVGSAIDQMRTRATMPEDEEEVFEDIVEIIEKEDNALILLTQVKLKLMALYGKFEQHRYGYEKFKSMMEVGANQGYFRLHTAGLRDWLTVSRSDSQPNGVEMPNELDGIFQEIRIIIEEIVKDPGRENAQLSYIKLKLKQKYGGFDESVYGYSRFKLLMEEGESMGYFQLGVNENNIDCAILPE
jgi:uncharacterized protein (TIGR00288 family)